MKPVGSLETNAAVAVADFSVAVAVVVAAAAAAAAVLRFEIAVVLAERSVDDSGLCPWN